MAEQDKKGTPAAARKTGATRKQSAAAKQGGPAQKPAAAGKAGAKKPAAAGKSPAPKKAATGAGAKTGARSRKAAAAPASPVSDEERLEMVREAAYRRAEGRGFQGGDADADWYEAEKEVEEQLRQRRERSPLRGVKGGTGA